MKLGTFRHDTREFVGLVDEGDTRVLDLTASGSATFRSMLALIDAGPAGLEEVSALVARQDATSVPLDQLAVLAPVPEPRQLRDVSLFPDHIRHAPMGMARLAARMRGDAEAEAAARPLAEVPAIYRRQPIFYFQNRLNVVGHGAVVTWPRASKVMDFELGFGFFIGRTGRDIPVARAYEHVFGYAAYNDFSARDLQVHEAEATAGSAKSKSFDGANVIGPWITTTDELPDPRALTLRVRVNGEVWGEASSAPMLHGVDEIVAYLSRDETLHAGEFIGLGTVGRGCGLELGRYLRDGDGVELEVERIGRLSAMVVRQ